MASSPVDVSSLRTSFGCVLRDRNRRHSDDVKAQVKTALPESAVISDENSQNRVGSCVGNKPKKNNKSRLRSPEKPRTSKGNNFSVRSKRNDHLGGASSLVQMWESRLNRSTGGNSPIHEQSIESVQEIHLPAPFIDGESESENESKNRDRTVETESGTLHSVSDSGEGKCGRVADIIWRLSNKQSENDGTVDMPVVQSLMLTHLECDLAIKDRHQSTTKGDLNHFEPGSRVLNLREKFWENAANVTAEVERRNGQQSSAETERKTKKLQLKELSIVRETTSTGRLIPRSRKIEEVLRKNETESKMSYLKLQEPIVAETLKSISDNTIVSTSVTHQEPQILPEEGNKVESVTQVNQETPFLEQEEYEDEQSYYGEMNYDWFTEISRPRTYWEDLRKSRYLEVRNTRSEKDDICRLLERKTVSGFLQSELRENIDKIIMSRGQTHLAQLNEEAGKEEEKSDKGEEDEDEFRDDLSHTSSQIFAPSPLGSWSSQDIGVTSTQPSHLIPLHNLNSSEMETISDLRSQILQLRLEMSELRDSVKTCLDVNASLQKSVHRENPLKRKCCVCNETQVETLLYRCGHICTCLRCANELQWNGGKCPICHAKILDVVRVFVDSTT